MKKLFLLLSICCMLAACGNSVPSCDSEDVEVVLQQMIKDNGEGRLIKNAGIVTVKSDKKTCLCKSVITVERFGVIEDIPVEYEINLADNKEEFTVVINYKN